MANRKNRFVSLLIIAFLIATQGLEAQKTYFVYLQSDNQQPFSINIRGKNISSSAIGYVILPKLVDSTYPVKIAYNTGGQVQEFDLVVNGNDQGFIIKDFGEKGYGLFNLQSLAVQMNVNGAARKKEELALGEKRVRDSLAAEAVVLAEKQKADSVKLAAEQEAKKKTEDSIALAKASEEKSSNGTGIVAAAGATAVGVAANSTSGGAKSNAEPVSQATNPAVVAAPAAVVVSKPADSGKTEPFIKDSLALKDTGAVKDTSLTVLSDSSTTVKDTAILMAKDSITGQPADTLAVAKTAENEKPLNDSVAHVKGAIIPAAAVTGVAVGAAAATNSSNNSPAFLDMELGGDSTQTEPKPVAKDSALATTAVKDSVHKDSLTADSVSSKTMTDTTVKEAPAKLPGTSSATGTITMNTPNASVVAPAAAATGVVVATEKSSTVSNTACKKIASEKDFYSVRKKMVASDDPAQMILTAKAAFKEKCFTNDQLRNLCVLFLDDASRYRFLDEAYPYATDPQSYKQLADLMKDDYYVRRFNAMLK